MVIDYCKNTEIYESINTGFRAAFMFIKNYNAKDFQEGKILIDGDRVYAIINQYQTCLPEEKDWETHQDYIDIHYIIDGKESFYWANKDRLASCMKCVLEKDCFIIAFPEDAHKPGCIINKPGVVKKIVVKVKVCE